ncbi:unnamed protein product [Moneuplotes crassus]|uniref:Uncharacterized protein n=1 Tax=Euplotes crassus TaxID=5936 RepID=A0AAD2DBT7_EUPCR|nr:unnamed protein product [Moneuplotes crassus]
MSKKKKEKEEQERLEKDIQQLKIDTSNSYDISHLIIDEIWKKTSDQISKNELQKKIPIYSIEWIFDGLVKVIELSMTPQDMKQDDKYISNEEIDQAIPEPAMIDNHKTKNVKLETQMNFLVPAGEGCFYNYADQNETNSLNSANDQSVSSKALSIKGSLTNLRSSFNGKKKSKNKPIEIEEIEDFDYGDNITEEHIDELRIQNEKNRKIRIMKARRAKKEKKSQKKGNEPKNENKSKNRVKQKFLTYDEGKLINPMRVNADSLPKFFKKGMEKRQGQDQLLIQKTDRSRIIEEYKKILEDKLKAKEENLKAKPDLSKGKSSRLAKRTDFSKTLVDAVRIVSDSIKPNYGVGITGKNIKMTSGNDQSVDASGENDRGITTSRDDYTGMVKVKALPYVSNPRLHMALTRKQYFENGIDNLSQRTLKKFEKKNKKLDGMNLNKNVKTDNFETAQHSSKRDMHGAQNPGTGRLTQDQTSLEVSHIGSSIEDLGLNDSLDNTAFLPSIRLKSQKLRKLLVEDKDVSNENANKSIIGGENYEKISVRRRFNMSMLIPSATKLTSPAPVQGSFRGHHSKMAAYLEGSADRLKNKRSESSQYSGIADRLIDYQQNKNARMMNLSTHEKFNIDILTNPNSWGEAVGEHKKDSTQSLPRKAKNFGKSSILNEIYANKTKILGQKQRLFQLKMKGGHALPPPPFGKSMGHGIVSQNDKKASMLNQEMAYSSIK